MIRSTAEVRNDEPASARRVAAESAVVALVVFCVYALTRPDAVAALGRLYDDVVYLSVGKSIASGEGYRSVHLVGSPVHVKFPPVLPTVYAAGWRAFGTLAAVAGFAQWLNILITSGAAAALWWVGRRDLHVGPAPLVMFVAVPILSDRTAFYFTGAMGEPWMLLAWAIALILVTRLRLRRDAGVSTVGMAAGLGLVLAAAVLVRTQAISVALGVLAGLAIMRVGWRPLVAAVTAVAVPVLAWRAWHGAMMARGPLSPLPDQTTYESWIPAGLGELTDFAATMTWISVPLYWRASADIVVGWLSTKTLMLASLILAASALGLAMLTRRYLPLVLSIIASIGLVLTWPYVQDRFLTPIMPVLGLAGAYAAQRVLDRLPRMLHNAALVGTALVGVLLLAFNVRARFVGTRGAGTPAHFAAITAVSDWVRRNTTPNERVMVPWGGAVYLHTNRKTSIPNPEEPVLGPSVFDAPRSFLATRLIADTVDVVVMWNRAPGRASPWLLGMAVRCPGLLTEAPPTPPAMPGLRFFRVDRDLPCLRQLAETRVGAGAENNNAP